MKKVFKIIVVLVALVCLFSSCHKYPEDPFISLRNPINRLMGTKWKFTSYKINGVDHSHDFDGFLSPNTLTDITFSFDKKEEVFFISNYNMAGQYDINADKKSIWLGLDSQFPGDTVGHDFGTQILHDKNGGVKNYWIILELYNKKFHITNNGADIYLEKQ